MDKNRDQRVFSKVFKYIVTFVSNAGLVSESKYEI